MCPSLPGRKRRAASAAYECCTARGALVALNAKDGRLVWKTHTIEQDPQPTAKNSAGTQMYGPAGGAVWSAPTIDAKRSAVYIGTGDSYTDVKENGSDAIIALDLATGKVKWRNQVTENDSFLMGCYRPGTPNCPTVKRTGFRFRRIADTVHAAQWQGHPSGGSKIRRGIWDGSGSREKRFGATRWAPAVRWAASNGAWLPIRSDCMSR